ncbi:MAG: glycoside hydrolase family 127 protein [Planctomycetes bacterium]|nr:glycoside hydrolase family 127 protein [Planctomycetota bacterium]MBL7143973.1 glycoside hydrolase family 127 protein [Phycisphaerae bacterium]
MNRLKIKHMFVLIAVLLSSTLSSADTVNHDYGIIKNQNSPHAKLKSVDLKDVRWTDGFWADQFAKTCDVTLPRLWELASDPEKGHAIQNLRIAAGIETGNFEGTHWQDAWIYKWLESACYIYAVTGNRELDEQMDEIINVISRAQRPDGYIASQTIARNWPRLQNQHHHELYTMGHLITAACIHHRITGKATLLNVARKAADYIYDTFKGRDPKLADFPINPSIIMAGVELYRTTGVKKYLDMSNFFIDWRGSRYGNGRRNAWGILTNGSDLNQNWRPLRKETEVVGHAVFFSYLYAGAADAFMETGDKTLFDALERLWSDLVNKKMYITGGVSPMHKAHPVRSFQPGHLSAIVGDSIHEGVGGPYDLPNDSAYNETCGQIGNLMWNWRMLAITGQAQFADIMERTLFNSILSGIEVDGDNWSYTNPLRWHGHEHLLRSNDTHKRLEPGKNMICCPTNLMRTVASWHNYLYSTNDKGLWIHHYGGNVFDGEFADGRKLKLTQKTDYPWDGNVHITIDAVDSGNEFSILLRIPAWAKSSSLEINHKPTNIFRYTPSSYTTITRKWAAGDTIELNLPMPVRLISADPLIEQTRNQVAVMRGPLVYCLESIDVPEGIQFEDIYLPANAKWKTQYKPDLLGGVTVLKTKALVLDKTIEEDIGGYRQVRNIQPRHIDITMIPYYAWNNRDEPKMTVWLPVRW